MIRIYYNVTGEGRQALVRAISDALGESTVYLGAPSFAYRVGGYTIDRNGTVSFLDIESRRDIVPLTNLLRKCGFEFTHAEKEADDFVSFTVEMPKRLFTDRALDNLDRIIDSKAELLKRALKTDSVDVIVSDSILSFPWFKLQGLAGETDAYVRLVLGICNMARRQNRVVAKERNIVNDKFTMRVFLLRLGFIGEEYKNARKILLQNLTGNSSWLRGEPAENNKT